jgi:hypothetical protein
MVSKPIQAFVDIVAANTKQGMSVAEVGIYDGSTTFAYIDLIKEYNGHLYLVDWFQGNEGNDVGVHCYRENGDPLYNQVKDEIENRGLSDYVTILYGKSVDMSKQIKDGELDICFIDSDHRYAGCRSDIRSYYPKVKHGGIISGHDCENINISDKFLPEDMFIDYLAGPDLKARGIGGVPGCHPGVITAVYERFGDSVDIIPDPRGQGVPIWVKYVDKNEDRVYTVPRLIKNV